MKDNILLIRMAEPGDVLAIGLPAVRYFKQQYPDATISVLTYGHSQAFFTLGEPDISVITLPQGKWPDNILMAMEVFLGLAEQVIQRGFSRIVNLDSAFMPCFLARFLKDSGLQVDGNTLAYSVNELIKSLEQESLSLEQVTVPEQYLNSTWFSFAQWFTSWWDSTHPPQKGYPEFYLARCCGFSAISIDMTLPYTKVSHAVDVVIFTEESSEPITDIDYAIERLDKAQVSCKKVDAEQSIESSLNIIGSAKLLVTTPSAFQWYAEATNTPVLLLSGQFDPRITMPNYATAMNEKVSEEVLVADIIELVKGPQ